MPPSQAKAKEMLRHGKVHGRSLTKKQRGLFGAVASGVSVQAALRRKRKGK